MPRLNGLFRRTHPGPASRPARPSRARLTGHIPPDALEPRTLLSSAYFAPPAMPADPSCADAVHFSRGPQARSHPKGSHQGYDLQLSQLGTTSVPVPTAEAGTVVRADNLDSKGYGNVVVVEYSDGTSQLFAHLASMAVKVGDHVSQGEDIGIQGNTGRHTGPTGIHLHTEIGTWVPARHPSPGAPPGRLIRDPNPDITRQFVDEYIQMLEQGRLPGQCLNEPSPVAPAPITTTPPVTTPPVTTPPATPTTYLVSASGTFGDGPFFGDPGFPATITVQPGQSLGGAIASAFTGFFTQEADGEMNELKPGEQMAPGARTVVISSLTTVGTTVSGTYSSSGGSGDTAYSYSGSFTLTSA